MTGPGLDAELVVGTPVIAAVAAATAVRVPGVARLEPGVLGVLGHYAGAGSQLWSGLPTAPTAGVRVRRAQGRLTVQIDLALTSDAEVVRVGRAVQRAVVRAVADATGEQVDSVTISVLDIDPR
ncbi:Asp23/Gls24 family envelope stress response protein [Nocardia rhizosphaerae]|uniref:Asp23/Gls24 family envelope stress response protein n=1 Tax=Nocardia rhizosphaerae TaxID=1691571 RepID=A0ABV8LAM9_9NOCA